MTVNGLAPSEQVKKRDKAIDAAKLTNFDWVMPDFVAQSSGSGRLAGDFPFIFHLVNTLFCEF